MAEELVKIKLNQQDIKDLVIDKYNLESIGVSISVSHWNGDGREPEYTSIVVTGKKKIK
jgi:hypothetical protein